MQIDVNSVCARITILDKFGVEFAENLGWIEHSGRGLE